MAASDPRRRRLSARIAAIESHDKPDDPRLPALRQELNDLAIAEIHDWAHRAAAALPPLTRDEIGDVAQRVRVVDARIARQAAARPAPAPASRPAATPVSRSAGSGGTGRRTS